MSISGLTNIFTNPNPTFLPIHNAKLNGNCRIKLRVYAKTNDCDVRIANTSPNARVFDQFSAPVKPSGSTTSSSSAYASSKHRKEAEEKQNYYVNMGYAIRCLREEFPELFHREPTFDIYRDDIVFKDPLNTFAGIENYKTIFWALRLHGRIFFRALWVEILSVWQPMENIILVRWTVHGIPRVPWESRGHFDGMSEYKLDKNGKIYEHKVDNIALNSHRNFRVLSVQEIILSLSVPSTPKPTCFEFSAASIRSVPSVRHCLDSALNFSQKHEAESSQKPYRCDAIKF